MCCSHPSQPLRTEGLVEELSSKLSRSRMKHLKAVSARIQAQKLTVAAVLLLPCFLLALSAPKLESLSFLNLKPVAKADVELHAIEEKTKVPDQTGTETVVPLPQNANNGQETISNIEMESQTRPSKEKERESVPNPEEITVAEIPQVAEKIQKEDEHTTGDGNETWKPNAEDDHEGSALKTEVNPVPDSSGIVCDLSEPRSDSCSIRGDDVRVIGYASSVILVQRPQANSSAADETTWKIKPFTRKWEKPTMEAVKEITVKTSTDSNEIPQCTITHSVPAVVFSLGGFLENFFHHFTDLLVPLFTTSNQYKGQVQFLVTNYNAEWIKKYENILKRLSVYDIINLDQQGNMVHCFQNVHVGLITYWRDLSINPSKCPNGCTMDDFRGFLRQSFSLKKKEVKLGDNKPRLLLMYRTGSRSFTNLHQIVAMARGLGIKVVLAGPEETRDLPRIAEIVNSCDIMMGVHGAGLTNLLFLPNNATLIQIVPWGSLQLTCKGDFGWPAEGMGLRDVEYEIKEEESTLIDIYPRNHTVFTDPASIERTQGWHMLWSIFLTQQSVKLDIERFRGVLQYVVGVLPR